MKERLVELLKEHCVLRQDVSDCTNRKTDDCPECLADYLIANGVIVPPCKVGDTVYAIYDKKVYEAVAEQVTVVSHISGNNIIKIKAEFDVEDWFYNDGRKTKYGIYGYYQENVFLTKEEAEQSLVNYKSSKNDVERKEDEGK